MYHFLGQLAGRGLTPKFAAFLFNLGAPTQQLRLDKQLYFGGNGATSDDVKARMQTKNDQTQGNLHGPAWHLQSEFSLPGKPESDDQDTDLAVRSLMQAVQDLGVPSVILERIKGSLEKATSNIRRFNLQEGSDQPLIMRLFTQAGQHSREGWGYFLIERMAPHSIVPSGEPRHSIELFLYREGSWRAGPLPSVGKKRRG